LTVPAFADRDNGSGTLFLVARYFHLDRNARLAEGAVIRRVSYTDVEPASLQVHVDEMFPNGVTAHGERHFVASQALPIQERGIELLFEYVRRAHFPERPSRFESVFAFDTLSNAQRFRDEFGTPDAVIWEIQAERMFRADMNYLRFVDHSTLRDSYYAHRYWSGESSTPDFGQPPSWEILLETPAETIKRVDER
jgi:hypothetical protein